MTYVSLEEDAGKVYTSLPSGHKIQIPFLEWKEELLARW